MWPAFGFTVGAGIVYNAFTKKNPSFKIHKKDDIPTIVFPSRKIAVSLGKHALSFLTVFF